MVPIGGVALGRVCAQPEKQACLSTHEELFHVALWELEDFVPVHLSHGVGLREQNVICTNDHCFL